MWRLELQKGRLWLIRQTMKQDIAAAQSSSEWGSTMAASQLSDCKIPSCLTTVFISVVFFCKKSPRVRKGKLSNKLKAHSA